MFLKTRWRLEVIYKRRLFLRGIAMLGALALVPKQVFAKWSEAFDAESADDALNGLYNSNELIESDQIHLKVPEIAENGAVVPVNVKTDLENVKTISILADKNPQPLAASFTIPEGTAPDVSIRIRLLETMDVKAIVEADGKLFAAHKEVKVTIGGCGG